MLSLWQSILAKVTRSFKAGCSTLKLMVFIFCTQSYSASRKQYCSSQGPPLPLCISNIILTFSRLLLKTNVFSPRDRRPSSALNIRNLSILSAASFIVALASKECPKGIDTLHDFLFHILQFLIICVTFSLLVYFLNILGFIKGCL